jgi:hypothetical protein
MYTFKQYLHESHQKHYKIEKEIKQVITIINSNFEDNIFLFMSLVLFLFYATQREGMIGE